MTNSELNERIFVSSPGKVILFGEHSVVYQKTAVAASLGLRSYLYLEKRKDDTIKLILPDVDVNKTWSMEELKFNEYPELGKYSCHPDNMPTELSNQLDKLIDTPKGTGKYAATLAFLYLTVIMAAKNKSNCGYTICVRSCLPVGAGLGSSASYSVVIATALLILNDMIPVDFNSSDKKDAYLEKINNLAFTAEQVIHGNPSGVDNAVATFGGAKSFKRGESFATLEGFQSLRLLLTNTKVPRSTSALVAGVGEKKKKYPEVMDPILESMDQIAIRCRDAFIKLQNKDITSGDLMNELEDLVDINHCLLQTIGVSHPSLEKVRGITAASGLKTKLTGAGGGGCAVTFIRDDVSQDLLDKVMDELRGEGFDCYETSVGGVGADAVVLTGDETDSWLLESEREALEKYVK
ncbi:mevalonate kinase-like protein [Backusella circina FSU 941]|nr:mevalonate kinase-like protein [Backusella circina FSU 941]